VLRRWDDGYLIRLDPGVAPEIAARVLGEVNAHFVEQGEPLLTPSDTLFVGRPAPHRG
jgi:hypothetical protein